MTHQGQGGGVPQFYVKLVHEEGRPWVELVVRPGSPKESTFRFSPFSAELVALAMMTHAIKAREADPSNRQKLADGLKEMAEMMAAE